MRCAMTQLTAQVKIGIADQHPRVTSSQVEHVNLAAGSIVATATLSVGTAAARSAVGAH